MKTERRNYSLMFVAIFLLFLTIFIFYLDWQGAHRKFTFAMLDIGQGDAFFIESPTGVQILVDAGPPKNILRELPKVMPLFDRSIDAIIMTHPDSDHVGGLADVLKLYKVGSVFESGVYSDTKTYQNIENEIKRQNIPNLLARQGMKLDLGGGAYLDILFPDRNVYDWETNDASVVAKLTYGDMSAILTGDATKETEKIILGEYTPEDLRSTILKVGHHGSRFSTSADFVKAVSPNYAFISVGKGNTYGHPTDEVLQTLKDFGVKVLRTDMLGTVIMKCDTIGECKLK